MNETRNPYLDALVASDTNNDLPEAFYPQSYQQENGCEPSLILNDRSSSAPSNRFLLEDWAEITPSRTKHWTIKRLLASTGLAVIFGRSSTYKSMIVIDMAVHIAAGRPWAGLKVTQGPVVYVASEGAEGVRKRITGIKRNHSDLPEDLPFSLISVAPNLGSGVGDLPILIEAIKTKYSNPRMIVIDTLSQSLGGGDENGPGMVTFITNTNALCQHFEALVLVIHHTGHSEDKRLRGHSSLIGAADVAILCEKGGEDFRATLTIQKLKDEASGLLFEVALSRVVIDIDDDGEESSTLVVDYVQETSALPAPKRQRQATKSRLLLTEVILHAIEEVGVEFRPFGTDGPVVPAVSEKIVRERYYERLAEDPDPEEDPNKRIDKQRKSFTRTINKMADEKLLITGQHLGIRHFWFP